MFNFTIHSKIFFFLYIFTSYIFGMETTKSELLELMLFKKDIFIYDLKRKILLELAQNVHRYIGKASQDNNPLLSAKKIIFYVGLVNKDLYNALNKERNDAVASRNIIRNIALSCEYENHYMLSSKDENGELITGYHPLIHYTHFETLIAKMMNTPGSKKCLKLSKQLYSKKLTTKKINRSFKEGALLNYYPLSATWETYNPNRPLALLSHWIQTDYPQKLDIIKLLLKLGAHPDLGNQYTDHYPLISAILKEDTKIIKILLKYKAQKPWEHILIFESKKRAINYIIKNSTQKELNDGLTICAQKYRCDTAIIEEFIKHGADPNIIFNNIAQKTIRLPEAIFPGGTQHFQFLCNQGAFNQQLLNNFKDTYKNLESFIQQLENNQFERSAKTNEAENIKNQLIQLLENTTTK